MASISTVVTDFTKATSTTIDPTFWKSIASGITQSADTGPGNGYLSIPCTAAYPIVATYKSSPAGSRTYYDLTNSSVAINYASGPLIGNGTTGYSLQIFNSTGDTLTLSWGGGALTAEENVGGTVVDANINSGLNDRWWRIRHLNGWIYWETSPDGSRWITRHSKASTFAPTSSGVYLFAGYYGTETSPAPFIVKSVNVFPAGPPPRVLQVGQVWDGTLTSVYNNESAPTDANGARVVQTTVDGRNAISMKAYSGDTSAVGTPTVNPRAQLVSLTTMYEPGCVYRSEVEIKFPTGAFGSFVGNSGNNWLAFVQWAYGSPFSGSPPLRMITRDGTNIAIQEQDFTMRGTTPIVWDHWMKFVVTQRFAVDGWYELRIGVDGAAPTITVPKRNWTTIYPSNDGGANHLYLDTYFSATTPLAQVGPIYFANVKVTRLQEAHGVMAG